MNLASPWNWIYRADVLAKDIRWYEKHVTGPGPFKFVEHVKGSHWVGKKNPDYWDKGKPYLDGYRAIFVSSSLGPGRGDPRRAGAHPVPRASARPSGTASSRRWARRSRCRRARGTACSWWRCTTRRSPSTTSACAGRSRLALDRYEGSKALSKIAIVKDVGGVQVPGTPYATPPAELEKLAGYGRDIAANRAEAKRLLQGGRRARRLLVHVQEPRDPDAVRAGRRSGSSTSGGRSAST